MPDFRTRTQDETGPPEGMPAHDDRNVNGHYGGMSEAEVDSQRGGIDLLRSGQNVLTVAEGRTSRPAGCHRAKGSMPMREGRCATAHEGGTRGPPENPEASTWKRARLPCREAIGTSFCQRPTLWTRAKDSRTSNPWYRWPKIVGRYQVGTKSKYEANSLPSRFRSVEFLICFQVVEW